MSRVLEAAQQQERHEVPDVQAVGGRIEADVEHEGTLVEARAQRGEIGVILHEAARQDVVDDRGAAHAVKCCKRPLGERRSIVAHARCEPRAGRREGVKMGRSAVSSTSAPPALGPYSQAIVANGFVFCSGTAGIDPATGEAPEGIAAQTEQALLNLAAVLAEAGASMDDLVKTTIFYADVATFGTVNEIYARHMPDPPPARSAPANAALPRGLLISIEAIAVLPS